MAEPQDMLSKAQSDDLVARTAAVQEYLADPALASPPSIDYAGGIVIHVPPFGSFDITPEASSRLGVFAMVAFLVCAVLFLGFRLCLFSRHKPKS